MTDTQQTRVKNLDRAQPFSFRCAPDLICFTDCCRQLDLALTPYDVLRLRRALGISDEEMVVANFGLLNASKGVDVLLRAARRILDAGVPLRLLLVGDQAGSSDPTNHDTALLIRTLAESLGLTQHITWTGFLPPEEVSAALAAADVAALPYTDGASLRRGSLLACFAHGLPVVTTRPVSTARLAPSVRVAPFEAVDTYCITGRVAALVPTNDEGALAAEILSLRSNRERRERLTVAAQALVAGLTWENVALATAAVYERVLAQKPSEAQRMTCGL